MSDFSALYGIFKRCCNKILSYQFFKTLRSAPRSRYFISHRKQHTRKTLILQAFGIVLIFSVFAEHPQSAAVFIKKIGVL